MKQTLPYLIPQPKSMKLDPRGSQLIIAAPAGDVKDELPLKAVRDASIASQGYRLSIRPSGIQLRVSDQRGLDYGLLTLTQLLRQYANEAKGAIALPCMEITDAPDFEHRGFMLDISRGRVPKLETLFALVDLLRVLKYNHFQLYIEHTYAFKKHPLLGKGHSPISAVELKKLDKYCRANGIEFAPNLQSFGHAAHILKHKKYHHLAESEFRGGWTLSPVESGTYKLLEELYKDFLPNFSHRPYFNVGCDETWDLGRGKSKPLTEKIGLGRVYLGHLLKVHKLVRKHGRRMMFWGDIIEKYPDLVPEIPKDVVLLLWEYEAGGEEKRYRKRLEPARKAGREHWVCPGTSSWNSFFFRKENARVNIREFAKAGVAAGSTGFLLTTWGDNGHYNFLSQSFWAIAYGADCAWRAKPDAAAEKEFDERFCSLALDDDAMEFLEPLRLLGNLSRDFGVEIKNTSPERMFLTGPFPVSPLRLGVVKEIPEYNKIKKGGFVRALKNAERAAALLNKIHRRDGMLETIREEWLLGAQLAAHACKRALWFNHNHGDPNKLKAEIQVLAKDFERLWLARDRESDLRDIRAEFAATVRGYDPKNHSKISFG